MKKGLSTMISTVLLISFVIALGLIVITWSSGLVKKSVERSETRVGTELECSGVKLKLEPSGQDIIIKNNGDEDVKSYIARIITSNKVEVDDKNENRKIEAYGASTYKYGDFASEVGVNVGDINKIEIIPQINIDGEIIDCTGKMIVYTFLENE